VYSAANSKHWQQWHRQEFVLGLFRGGGGATEYMFNIKHTKCLITICIQFQFMQQFFNISAFGGGFCQP